MASSQGCVRPSPMAYPAAVRPLPKLPLPLRPETGPTSEFEYVFGQNMTEYNLRHRPPVTRLSGLTDIHQIFT